MNYIKTSIFIIISLFLVLQSCSTDVNINGEWKDIPIIYCVLDQTSETQYIKINKSFLGPHPASEMAKHSDSLFYNSNITAYITEFNKSENKIATHYFEKTDHIAKQEGYFGNDKNTIWEKKINLNEENTYKLYIDINNGKHQVSSETKLIRGTRITKPNKNMPNVNFRHYDKGFKYEYIDGPNTKLSQMEIIFNYREVSDKGVEHKSVTWGLPKEKSSSIDTDAQRVGEFNIGSFYSYLENSIPDPEPGVIRYAERGNSVIFRVSAVDENYNTFMEISAPPTGLIQERPAFTNINGGYGLFASRTRVANSYNLAPESLDSLSFGTYMKTKGFADQFKTDTYYNGL